jgi:hypothetical protein
VTAFNDALASFNAYVVQAGGALVADFTGYPDTVMADSPARYYRLNEASGTTAFDGTSNGQNGTLNGTITTYQATGLLTGDSDPALVLGAGAYLAVPTTGLSTGAGAWSLTCVFKTPSSVPGANIVPLSYGSNTPNAGAFFQITGATNVPTFGVAGGSSLSGTALSTSTIYHLALTYDGTTLRASINGTQIGTGIAVTLAIALGGVNFGAYFGGTNTCVGATLDECAVFTSALSGTRVSAESTAVTTTPTNLANTLHLPTGGRIAFGSSAWGPLNTWQLRFQWLPKATVTCSLHETDANTYLAAQVQQGTVSLVQVIAGVTTTLQSTNFGPPYLAATSTPGGSPIRRRCR